jgi:hypothetical protein
VLASPSLGPHELALTAPELHERVLLEEFAPVAHAAPACVPRGPVQLWPTEEALDLGVGPSPVDVGASVAREPLLFLP